MKSTTNAFGGRCRKLADAPKQPDPPRACDLIVETLKSLVAAYDEARRLEAEGWRLDKDRDDEMFSVWAGFRQSVTIEAGRRLMEGILIAHRRGRHPRDLKNLGTDWPACAWELNKVLYVVSQDEDDDDYCPVLAIVATKDFAADWGIS